MATAYGTKPFITHVQFDNQILREILKLLLIKTLTLDKEWLTLKAIAWILASACAVSFLIVIILII